MGQPPAGEHRLDRELARRAPDAPGIYAAWISDAIALAEAGIEGPPPVLLYVGKATNLRNRLRRHAAAAWWPLLDLLASRQTVLPGWWSYAAKNTTGRTVTIPPLASVAHDQAIAWQHRNLWWGWITDLSVDIGKVEAAHIAAHRPLLNRRGKGYLAEAPMQLQRIGRYERERAWWLFHASWLAVLTLKPGGWIQPGPSSRPVFWESESVAADDEGWPVRLVDGVNRDILIPDDMSARETLVELAPQNLRVKVADISTPSEEATAWWAAYAGHPFLRGSHLHERALRAALARSESAYAAPVSLPSGSKLADLTALIRQLPWVTH